MGAEELLEDLKAQVEERVPQGVNVSKVEFEGPELVIYTDSPRKFADDGTIVRDLAKGLRKRITIRPNSSQLTPPEEAKERVHDVVPEEAGVTNISFDPMRGETVIEARKPGLVIGRYGSTLRDVTKEIGWTVKVVRTPPIESKIIDDVRQLLLTKSEERKETLERIGRNIHRDVRIEDDWVRLTALGGYQEVGRSATLLSTPETKVLIDCGVKTGAEDNGTPYLYVPEISPLDSIDAVVLTHAHLDHSGLVPLLFKYGYRGPVYSTSPTRDLASLLQLDYIDIAEREGRNKPYNSEKVRKSILHTIPLDHGEVTDIAPDVRLTLHNAGHIIGSSIAHLHIGEGRYNVAFTGDLNFSKSRLFDPASSDFPRVDTLVLEGTYGGSQDRQPSRKDAERKLAGIVRRTTDRGGKVLIPAFAVGRSQEVMLVLEEYMRMDVIPEVPVYLDGMIWDATAIHTAYPEFLNKKVRDQIFHEGENPFLNPIFENIDSNEMREAVITGDPSVILATSGMLSGGPVMEHLRHLAPEEENTLTFVGYQAEGTLGRRIQRGWSEISLPGNGRTESVNLEMEVSTIEGFSGHSDRQELIEFVRGLDSKPGRVVVNHGEESKCKDLSSFLYKKFHSKTRAPMNLETMRLL